MKLVHVIPYFLPSIAFGGPIFTTYYLCRELVRRGHEVVLLTTNVLDSSRFEKDFKREEVMDGILVRRYPVAMRFMSYYLTPGIIRGIMGEDAEIIHGHGYRNFQVDAGALCSWLKGMPFVLHPRGMASPGAAKERGSTLGEVIYRSYDAATRGFAIRRAGRIIAASEFEKEQLMRRRIPPKRIRVVPHGVDAGAFQRNHELGEAFRKKFGIDGWLILYAGRIDRGKNLAALLRACSSLQEKFKDLHLALVGGEMPSTQIGRASIREDLREYALKLGLENLVFTGSLRNEELVGAYSAADVFVNPSVSRAENFGLVNLEAAACSLPLVASPVGIATALLEEHDWLIFNDQHGLEKAMERLLDDEGLRKRIGRELRRKVTEEYTWARSAERVEKLYQKLLAA
jgi:glycosyltransferase involved in cell wall biosynthesis